MIILGQDKDLIVNFDNVSSIEVNDVWDNKPGQILKANDVLGRRHTLGYYKNEERAKEVLREIANEYSKYLELRGGPAVFQGEIDIQPNIFNIPKVYEMPED